MVAAAVAFLLSAGAAGCAGTRGTPTAGIDLHDSGIVARLEGRLPVTVLFNDWMGAVEVARLDEPLELREAEVIIDYQAGDVGYWPEQQSIVVFLHAGGGAAGANILRLGRITTGLADVANCTTNCPVQLDATAAVTQPEARLP